MRDAWLRAVMSGAERGVAACVTRAGLRMVEPGYAAVMSLRNAMFNRGLRHIHRLGRPTLSVGNLTTGGTGKTPMVIELVRRLQAMGHRPAVLLRGHGGGGGGDVRSAMSEVRCQKEGPREQHRTSPSDIPHRTSHVAHRTPPPPRKVQSDEAMEYIAALGNGVPIAADPDRVRSAKYILHHHPEVTCFVLDDGFQHRKVHRDLDLVLIDATCPWGYGHVLPRGMLREPVEGWVGGTAGGLGRADAVIVTRADRVLRGDLEKIEREVERLIGRPPVARAGGVWEGADEYVLADYTKKRDAPVLMRSRVWLACGIGNPKQLRAQAETYCRAVLGVDVFPDHQDYGKSDVERVMRQAAAAGADAVLTTRKDWVKWQPLWVAICPPMPVWVPRFRTDFIVGDQAVDALLRGRLPLATSVPVAAPP